MDDVETARSKQAYIQDDQMSLSQHKYEGGDQANSSKLSKSWQKAGKSESLRNKREAKKLQKYDSNSIDEEEFQDCKLKISF